MPKTWLANLVFLEGAAILFLGALLASTNLVSVCVASTQNDDPPLNVLCVDGGDLPLPEVSVTATLLGGPSTSITQTTDSFGRTTFNLSANSNYTITAIYRGTPVAYVPRVSLQTSEVNLRLNCTVFDWVITVYDSAGNETIEGAEVSISSTITGASSVSDASGSAHFSNTPEYSYTYTVRYQGFTVGNGNLYLSHQNQQDSIKTNMWDLIIDCLDVSERPAVGVTLNVWNSTGILVGDQQTGLDGRAKFKNLPGPTQYRAEALFQGKTVGSLNWFTLTADRFNKTMSVDLARFTLTVKDYNDVSMVSNLNLTASAYLDGELVAKSSSKSGNIDLGSLVLGTYSINVTFANVTVASFWHTLTEASQERTVNADFYDVTARVDASELLNSAQAQNLRMRLEYDGFAAESPVGVNGEAFFQDVPPARCNLTLSKGGTLVGSVLVMVSSQGQFLPPIKPTTHTLSLKVVNADLEPLLCSVRLVEMGGIPVSTLESNQSGVAVFPKILGLTYDVTVTCKGYEVGRQSVQVFRDGFLLIVAKVYWVEVTLTDYEGSTPMQGASIEATAPNLSGAETVLTDGRGKALFRDMPSAEYLLTAKFMDVKVSAVSVALSSNQNITFSSPGIYDLTVQCLDADGNSLERGEAQVLLAGKEVARKDLDEDGRARFYDLPNATYQISSFLYKEQIGTASAALSTQGQVVQLETNVSTLRVELFAADNTTIVDANVTVLMDGRSIESKAPSTTDHKASFALPVGSYRILVYYQDTLVGDIIQTHLSSKELDVPCTVYKVEVKAVDLRHEPIQGVEVYISKDSKTVLFITTNSSGLAEFYLAGGEHAWRIVMPSRTSSAVVSTERNLQILLLDVQDQPSLAVVAAAGCAISLLLLAVSLYLRRRTKMGVTGVREKRYRPRVPRI